MTRRPRSTNPWLHHYTSPVSFGPSFAPLFDTPDDEPDSGDPPASREPTPEEIDARARQLQSERRYRPIEYDRALREANGNAETALANVIEKTNGIADRRFQAEARQLIVTERELETVRAENKKLKADKTQLEKDKKAAEDRYAVLNGTIQAQTVEKLLADQNVSDIEYMRFALEHKEGYSIEVEGEGDAAKLVLKKGDQKSDYDAVVNADFFQKYPKAAIPGDTTLAKSSGDKDSDGLTPGQRMARARMGARHPSNQPQGS